MNPKTPEEILSFAEQHRLPEHYRIAGRTRRAFLAFAEWLREDVLATEGQRPDPARAGALANVLGDVVSDVFLAAVEEWDAQGRPPEPHPYSITGVAHVEADDPAGEWTRPPADPVGEASPREPREAQSTPAEPKDAPSASDEAEPDDAPATGEESKGDGR